MHIVSRKHWNCRENVGSILSGTVRKLFTSNFGMLQYPGGIA
jgi:hypothetical protein